MGVIAFAYLVAGYLYMWLSPRTDTADTDMRICIWILWLPLLTWDVLKALGKYSLRILGGILEVFD